VRQALALEKYGSAKFTWRNHPPSIVSGEGGFIIADDMPIIVRHDRRMAVADSAKSFPCRWRTARDGDRLIQPILAVTLSRDRRQGRRLLWKGRRGETRKSRRNAGGFMTPDDLKSYHALLRAPARQLRGYESVSALPSSRGTVLLGNAEHLEGFRWPNEAGSALAACHLEAMRRAYATAGVSRRSRFRQRADAICSPRIYAARHGPHRPDARRHRRCTEDWPATRRQQHTPFSVSTVAYRGQQTLPLNSLWCRPGAEGTGVLLKKRLDDFTAAPGASNASGWWF